MESCHCGNVGTLQNFPKIITGRRVLSIASGAQHSVALVQKLKRASLHRQSTSAQSQGSMGTESLDDQSRSDSPVVGMTQQHRYSDLHN